ncbi:MAG TPA: DUF4230 domain-containing protein [Flavobacteriales bacterium]|nr:DUF4230 domain-containing protein [Flavobacteriales bacterium]
MRRLLGLLLLLGFGLLVFFLTREAYREEPAERVVESTVLLERVRPVLKLVTVEGDFSEVYTYEEALDTYDWLKQFTPFRKKAILRVQARVSVGYDLEGLGIRVDEERHTVWLEAPPEPQVLAIDHDIAYYDLEEGAFNEFSADDLTRLNADAKRQIASQVQGSGLFTEAERQRDAVVEAVRALVENAGWKLELGWQPRDARSRL